MLTILILSSLAFADPERVGTVEHAPVAEQSGIVRSRRHEGVFWVHNDSGSGAALFAIHVDGTVVTPPGEWTVGADAPGRKDPPRWEGLTVEGASNIDWEDITTDGEHLYVAETGNNDNARRDLGVYVLAEPNPAATSRARALAFWPIRYPTQQAFPPSDGDWRYDCEAVFWHAGHLYLLTKHRKDGRPHDSTDLYRLDDPRPDRVNVAVRVDHAEDLGGWVTAADLSPDGTHLAVLAYGKESAVWIFPAPPVGDTFFSHGATEPVKIPIGDAKQAEGLAWASNDRILVTNEQRDVLAIDLPARVADGPLRTP